VRIPKGEGKETRPIGIPTTEDKVLQRAVAMLLEPIYEEQFFDFSYGFRPGRSAHQALQRIWKQIMDEPIQWIVEVDIRKFFDTLDHNRLREVLRQRVTDGVITKLIDKWLNAGVLEQQQLTYPEEGTPQGGVISPIISNVFLHEVLDKWFEQTVRPRLGGRAFLVRYADDFVMGFQRKDEAERVYKVLPLRFQKYGLSINLEKTRVVRFASPQGGENRQGPWLHPLLGPISQRTVVRNAQNRQQQAAPDASRSDALVSEEPASAHSRTAPTTLSKAARTLCILRNHW